jgi:hypothetical protein
MFDRARRYSSATDGWIISDQSTAKLYGLHTTTVFYPSRYVQSENLTPIPLPNVSRR